MKENSNNFDDNNEVEKNVIKYNSSSRNSKCEENPIGNFYFDFKHKDKLNLGINLINDFSKNYNDVSTKKIKGLMNVIDEKNKIVFIL